MAKASPDHAEPSTALHLPPDIHYECTMHGDCCCDFWEIRVDDEAVERISAADWQACSALPDGASSPFRKASTGGGLCMERIGEDCSFLGEDRLCRLHKAHGAAMKPRVCRTYPHRFVQTPGGVTVGLSFACSSVLEDNGPSVETTEAEMRAMLDDGAPRTSIADPIRLDADTPITWEHYVEIESALDAILANENETIEICLVAGHAWLGMLRQMIALIRRQGERPEVSSAMAEAFGENEGAEPDLVLKAAIGQTVSHYVKATRKDSFARAFGIARRPGAHPAVKRMLLGTFVSFRNTLGPRQWRLVAIARLLIQNLRHWTRCGTLRLAPLPIKVPYRRFRPDPEDLASDEMQTLLRRYFRHALFRKDLILDTDLFWGYCYFCLAYGLIQWYTTGLRAAGQNDPVQALALVEKYFVRHSNFSQAFLYHPAIADTIQHLFHKPNFAHSIVLG